MENLKEIMTTDWNADFSAELQKDAVHAIESEKILHFPNMPFTLSTEEKEFLSPIYADPNAKNVSYNRTTGLLRAAECSMEKHELLKKMMHRFSQHAENLVKHLLPAYANHLEVGRTSYRPIEIQGRTSSYRKDDTRLHVDAFPSTPVQGKRILRVFANINPHNQPRVWRVGESFAGVVHQFLPRTRKAWPGRSSLLKALGITKSYCTDYDYIMLQIHNQMKKDSDYQKTVPQSEIHFLPNTSWIVQTDHVSHAAMSGQYALEQTFYLPVDAMVNPELSPLRILEKSTGKKLV
ncbi:MAG: Kdo hydroxylase family protein [Proteobacteria bacterium]|nr:Kdo hydroxylase family protein [Pseudomonadota bacterium]